MPTAAKPQLQGKRFMVLGRAGMDFYAEPPGTRIEEASRFVAHLGGSAANIAVALVKLGAEASLVTTLSEDAVGRFCLAQLAHYGVRCPRVRLVSDQSRTSLAVVETRAENCQSVIYRNGAADLALAEEDIAALDFTSHAALVVTGTALAGDSSRRATMAALAKAKAASVTTVIDIDYRPTAWAAADDARRAKLAAVHAADIVVGNDVEFGLLAGGMDRGLDLARRLVAERAAIAVYKMGELGAVTVSKTGEFVTGIYRTAALKPTGAGDAFMGGFLSGLSDGLPLRDAVLQGSAAAAITVARVGCAPAFPTTDELEAFLQERSTDAHSAP